MSIVTQVTELLQGLLEESMDALARETGCVKRERKFSGSTLLSTVVLTMSRNSQPKPRDYQTTAAQLGVDVTENAITQRFTHGLVKFLEAALKRVIGHVLTTDAPPIELLGRFTQVVIGDSTTITLPDEYAEQFPGCGGSYGSGKAALKIQVLWDLRHGRLQMLLEPGRASDAKSPITELPLPGGSLSIFDLGYFSLERLERVERAEGYLDLQQWTIFVTNCQPSLLKWKEVVVLYRARWQIERLFKLWKSYNRLAGRDAKATAAQQLAEVYARLIAVIIQHGILLMTVWLDGRRSLWRAAGSVRDWIGQLIAVIDDAAKLQRVLHRQRQSLSKSARINGRRKHPSCFQLLTNPELLEYTVA